jgi:hypothetical protein
MKTTLTPYLKALFTFFIIAISSCESDIDPVAPEPNLSLINDDFLISRAFEDLDNVTLTVLNTSGVGLRVSQNIPASELCATAKVTLDKTVKNIIVDFGAGCTSSNGITRKGKVLLSYSDRFILPGSKVITSFDNYYVNGNKIEGKRTITNAGLNLFGGTISLVVKIENGKVIWPDNTFVTVASDQTREVKLGSDGYEASILGNAKGKSREGIDYTSEVMNALIVTESCVESGVWVPSKGVLKFNFEGIDVTVDYGDGTCDKAVTINYPGGSKEVILD